MNVVVDTIMEKLSQDLTLAIEYYDRVLSSNTHKQQKDLTIICLLCRCECYAQLDKTEPVISDSRRVLKLLADTKDVNTTVCRVRQRLIFALFNTQKLSQAEDVVREWLNHLYAMSEEKKPTKTIAVLERYLVIFQMSNGERGKRLQQAILDSEAKQLDQKLNNWIRDSMPRDRLTDKVNPLLALKWVDEKGELSPPTTSRGPPGGGGSNAPSYGNKNVSMESNNSSTSSASSSGTLNKSGASGEGEEDSKGKKKANPEPFRCTYCAINFANRGDLTTHCQSESHQIVIMSDEGRDWKCRPPPRGYTADSYTLCESFLETSVCHYGSQCIEAHGPEELAEWKQRFEYRRMRLERAREKELYGKSYTETLLEKWVNAAAPDQVMREKIDAISSEEISQPLAIVISSKISKRAWVFTLQSTRELRAVALLQDAYRSHFSIKEILPSTPNDVKRKVKPTGVRITNDQEWVNPEAPPSAGNKTVMTHTIRVAFSTMIYGTFRQSVVFDLGQEPHLVKHICVDVVAVSDMDRMTEIKKDLVTYTAERWDHTNAEIIPFVSGYVVELTTAQEADIQYEKDLMLRYPCPTAESLQLSQSTISEKRLTRNNYRNRMHELLYVEEIARYENVAKFNLTTKIKITSNYLLTPSGMATTSAKYSNNGELFGLLQLQSDISEDTSAGRLILNNCTSVNLSLADQEADKSEAGAESSSKRKRKVYEAIIEDKGKNSVYLKLSPKAVADLDITKDSELTVDIQFKLNRLTFCEWHRAVDKIVDYRLIFPDTLAPPTIPWTPKKQWTEVLDAAKLNAKQKEAILAITSPVTVPLPPILLIGPFGTGKTFTLALAIKQLLTQPEPRILICTHSNSAADLYIKEYLHPWVKDEGLEAARPLRVYYHKRWVATSHPVVQEYCLIDVGQNMRQFRRPTVEDVLRHRIVVVTLSISMELASLNLPKGHFTHILLDEAAQAMECEAIMPLALASERTKIVLAGDHMQMSPELFSEFAKERNMHTSLLERLYDHYPTDFPCKILLCENYRAHEAIIKYTSELFYDQKLIASGKQPRHDKFYPLTFFTTRGEDVQDRNSTTFYNNAEVYELVERVAELKKRWPAAWGAMDESSIGIMTPYADQVFRIRSVLRKRRLGGISVERVLNVQGKQFRAVFLSTVRTRKTCPSLEQSGGAGGGSSGQREVDYGFLSNSKLLNTAITRAQSLVAVIGDPVALCSIGRCRKVWERFIETCNENKSLFGITLSMLRAQLDGVELKKSYVLNPLAPEFVPRLKYVQRGNDLFYGGAAGQGGVGQPTGGGAGGANPMRFNQMAPYGFNKPAPPYKNIDEMLSGYHPPTGGPPGPAPAGHNPLAMRPMFNNPMNNPYNSVPNEPPAAGSHPINYSQQYYPQAQPLNSNNGPQLPPQPPPMPNAGYDRTGQLIPPNQSQQPSGPIVPPANNLWGPVPPNINPQLTGTNAWQMAKHQPGTALGGPPPPGLANVNLPKRMPPNQPNVQVPPGLRSPNGPQGLPQGMSPQWMAQMQNAMMNKTQSPVGMDNNFMGVTNHNHFANPLQGGPPHHPGLGMGMRNSNMNIPGMNPLYQQPPMPPNIANIPPQMGGLGGVGMAPADGLAMGGGDALHRMHWQQQQQLQLAQAISEQQMRQQMGHQNVDADLSLALLQERFMLMNAGQGRPPHMPSAVHSNPHAPPMKNGGMPPGNGNPIGNPIGNSMGNPMGINPIGVLLPPNKNLYEMAVESKDVQLKWFTKLVETHGWDAAYKFAEMMGQAQSALAQEFANRAKAPHMNHLVQHPQQQQLHLQHPMMVGGGGGPSAGGAAGLGVGGVNGNRSGGISSTSVSTINSQVDMAFDTLMNGGAAGRQRLFEEPTARERESGGGGLRSGAVDGGIFGSLEVAAAATAGNGGSVPLYRRQAGPSTASSSSVSSMSSQSAASGLFGESLAGGGGAGGSNSKMTENLFNRMTGDYGNMFGRDGGVGGGFDGQTMPRGSSNAGNVAGAGGTVTYASVLSQPRNVRGGGGEGPPNGGGMNLLGISGGGNRAQGMGLGGLMSGLEETQQPQGNSQQTGAPPGGPHNNGFYNYFG